MTVNEFAKEYDIPYGTVYAATWLVRNRPRGWYDKDYDEEELRIAVRESVTKKADRFRASLQRAEDVLRKIR